MFDQRLVNEAHAFLWAKKQEYFMNGGLQDAGWNCRDHTFVFGALSMLFNKKFAIANGKNMIGKGPGKKTKPIAMGQESDIKGKHTWLISGDKTISDYSLRLPNRKKIKEWGKLPDPVVENSKCLNIEKAEIILTSKEIEYNDEIALGTHQFNGFRIIYLIEKIESFSSYIITNPFSWINSPLSDKMADRYTEYIYIKLVMHLYDFMKERTKSVSHKSQIGAWNTINKRPDSDLEQYLELVSTAVNSSIAKKNRILANSEP